MELELYTALKDEIQTRLPEIKYVALFNNQFIHSNGVQRNENAFLYPCVLLEFSQSNFRDLSQGVQQFDITVTTHLGFESYKDEDTDVLRLKQELYKVVQRFRNGYFSKLTRIAERQDFDHDNIQVFVTEYLTTGKDFDKDTRPTATMSTGTTLTISATTITLSGLTI
jgi:hypothetical protein